MLAGMDQRTAATTRPGAGDYRRVANVNPNRTRTIQERDTVQVMLSEAELAEVRRQLAFHVDAAGTHEEAAKEEARLAAAHRKVAEGLRELYPALESPRSEPTPEPKDFAKDKKVDKDAPKGREALAATIGQTPGQWFTAAAIHQMLVGRGWAEDSENGEAATRANINRAVKAGQMQKRAVDARTQEYAWLTVAQPNEEVRSVESPPFQSPFNRWEIRTGT